MRSRRRLVARNLSVITTLAAFYFATVPFRCWYQIRCVKIICKGSILNTEMLGYELLTVGRYYAPQRDDQNKLVKLKPIDQAVKNAKITNNANDFTAHSKRTLKWFGVNLYKSLQNTTVLTTDQFTNIRDGHLKKKEFCSNRAHCFFKSPTIFYSSTVHWNIFHANFM